MPQPIMHYLVVRKAIPKRYWDEYWNKDAKTDFRPFFGAGSSAPDFFYLDLKENENLDKTIYFYQALLNKDQFDKTIKISDSTKLANAIHGDKSFDMFCFMLEYAKRNKIVNLSVAKKLFCFALGFYSHVITDCVLHPYVYRNSNDHWATKSFVNEGKHKIFEARLDKGANSYIRGNNSGEEKFKAENYNWDCKEKLIFDFSLTNNIDEDVWDMYDAVLKRNFGGSLYPEITNYELHNDKINNSYEHFQEMAERIENADNFIAKFAQDNGNNFFNKKIEGINLPKRTPKELFEIAVRECNLVFNVCFAYFASKEISAKEYFKEYKKVSRYINGENWNLDTGLPSKYNNEEAMLLENEEHFKQHLNELEELYKDNNRLEDFDE